MFGRLDLYAHKRGAQVVLKSPLGGLQGRYFQRMTPSTSE